MASLQYTQKPRNKSKLNPIADPNAGNAAPRSAATSSPIGDAFSSLAQSGSEMTNRITKNGAVGFPLAVGKEIVSGINQLGSAFTDPLISNAKAANANIVQPAYEAALPALIGSESAKQEIAERNAPPIPDPLANKAASTKVGLNGSIPDPSASRRPPPSTDLERQTSFNDDNYTPREISNHAIADPLAQPVSPTPFQDQEKQQQLAQLQQDASMEIDNSLPYDVRKTMAGKRDAAQKVLGIMASSNTADKNRASSFQAEQNKSILNGQLREQKAIEARNKEGGFFKSDDLEYLGDLSTDVKLKSAAIPKSEGNKFARMVAGLTTKQRAEALRTKRFDGMFDLDTKSIFTIFGLNEAESA